MRGCFFLFISTSQVVEINVLNNRTQSIRHFTLTLIFLFSVVLCLPAQAATVRYVSDELKVPLRSGATTGHRIIKFIKSGSKLTVLDTEGDFTQVKTGDGKTGWVLTENIMSIPSGRDRVIAANKQLEKAKKQVNELSSSVAELKAEIKQLKNEKDSLHSERTNLSNSLEDLKITAANPLSLSKKNKELKKELEKVRANEAMLEKDNQQLRSNVMQEWFMIGGAVSIGSLILGLIITRINWRRKRNSWGDSF